MGVFIYESEHSSVIAPVRLFKGFFLDAVNLFSKVASQVIKSSEILEGDGGVGTIMKLTFSEASPYHYVKRRIDIADEASYKYGYTVIEGDALIKYKLEKIEYRHELAANADGGCTVKSVSKYYFVDDVEIKEEDVKAEKEKGSGLFKLVEAYLNANPDLYN